MKDIFRKCASAVVLRSSNNDGEDYQVLLVHKPRKKDVWQLPQGGVEEGETTEVAALRELKEEAGLEASLIKKSEIVYQYTFPKSYRKFRPDNVCGQRIEFIFASMKDPSSKVIVDDDEIDSYVWTTEDKLDKYIHREEYFEIVKRLVEEGTSILSEISSK
ncbi:MAG: NUDIX hydrolase [Candidatus Peribacteraceae bacterium]|nr:NUDIX hydrolase [Candidatus Peribacteraceae bacterium]